LAADTNNAGLSVRRFDDSTEEGVGFDSFVPTGATTIVLDIIARPEVAATVIGDDDIQMRLYGRSIPDNTTMGTWTGVNLASIDIDLNTEDWVYRTLTASVTGIGLTGGEHAQFELTRDGGAGGDDLVGDWDLLNLRLSFT
jgi:hypothetical protein